MLYLDLHDTPTLIDTIDSLHYANGAANDDDVRNLNYIWRLNCNLPYSQNYLLSTVLV
jgi:hypothetical protein